MKTFRQSTYKRITTARFGFTLVEMMIVAPIVVLIIGLFVTAIVSMTGQVLTTRGSNYLTLTMNDTLDKITQDVKTSVGFLATNSITLAGTQGYNDSSTPTDTTPFHNADATEGNLLILKSYATTKNPLDSARNYIYTVNQPYACTSSLIGQNAIIPINIIYFIKNNSLWRRVIMQSDYTTASCITPWQQPSCVPGNVTAFCKTQDTLLVDGINISGFTLNYYTAVDSVNPIANAINNSLADNVRQTALNTAVSVRATITATKSIAGRNVSQTGTIDVTKNGSPISYVAPTADWVATTQGSHYGNFYNIVNSTWATVSATSTSKIFDPSTGQIYPVGTGYLGVNPRGDGRNGSEATVEEGRTNYALNSSFASGTSWTCGGADGSTCAYSNATAPDGTTTAAQLTIAGGGTGHYLRQQITVTAATQYTFSFFVKKGSPAPTAARYSVYDVTHSADIISTSYFSSLTTSNWTRISVTFTTPAACTSVYIYTNRDSGSATGSILYFWGAQLEVGAFATSYIPTTTVTVTRAANYVTVPNISNYNAGTIIAVFSQTPAANKGIYAFGSTTNDNLEFFSNMPTNIQTYVKVSNVITYGTASSSLVNAGYNVAYFRWGPGGVNCGGNGNIQSVWDALTMPSVAIATTYLGSYYGGATGQFSSPIQRILVYDHALTDWQINSISGALVNGA